MMSRTSDRSQALPAGGNPVSTFISEPSSLLVVVLFCLQMVLSDARSEGACLDLVNVWCRAKRACTKVRSVGDSLAIPPITPFLPTRAVPGEKTSVFRSQLVAHVRVDYAVLRPDSQALPAELPHKHW